VIGTATAYFLAREGFEVVVVEAREGVGLETSFANGGLVTPSMADPWAAPGLPLKLLKWAGREDSPFLIRTAALPGLFSWGLRFLANCRQTPWRQNTRTIIEIARYGQQMLESVISETGIDCQLSSRGTMRLFRDAVSMETARRCADEMGALGLPYRLLAPEGCVELEPSLSEVGAELHGGIHFPNDACGDAYLFTRALGDVCAGLGVEFRFRTSVTGLATEGGRIKAVETDQGPLDADHVVLALGSESVGLAREVGIKLPIYPVKGYSLTLPTTGWNRGPGIPLIDDGRKIGIVPLGDRIRLAGTAEFGGYDRSLNESRTDNLMRNFMALYSDFPNAADAEPWTGLRPMTPDGIPILGDSPLKNLSLNVGHGHLGWTMACGASKAVADRIAGRASAVDLSTMTLARF
jgi:D-amino-acid dehydrogenase